MNDENGGDSSLALRWLRMTQVIYVILSITQRSEGSPPSFSIQ